jgi:hypothetical protein
MQDCDCCHVPVTEGERLLGILPRGDFHAAELNHWRRKARYGSGCDRQAAGEGVMIGP